MTNPYAEAAAGLAAELPGNRYATAAADLAADQRVPAARTNALQPIAAPDAAASAARLSRQTGLPIDLVARNQEQVQRRVTADRIEADTTSAPVLGGRYTDPGFAAMAQDDSGPLSILEQALAGTAQFGRSIAAGAGPRFGAAAYGAAAYPFEAVGMAGVGDWFRRQQRSANAEADRWRGSLEGAGLLRRGIVSGGESAGQALVTLPLGWARAGYVTGEQLLLGAMGAQTFGQSYGKGRDAGASVAQSAAYGAQDAVAEVVTERFLGAAKLVADAKAGTGLAKLFMRDIAREIPGESLATLWQNFNEWANLNPEKPMSAWLQEQPAALAETAIATIVAGGAQSGAVRALQRVSERQVRAEAAQTDAAQLGAMAKAADASALKRRDPDTFAEFVDEVQPEARVYIAPEHLDGVDLSAVPDVAAQLNEAHATGGEVQLTMGELLGHLPAEQLLPHVRTEPDAMTLTEAQGRDPAGEIEQHIEAPARPVDAAMFDAPEQAGMDAETWAEYIAAADEAAQAATEARDARALRDLQWLDRAKTETTRRLAREAAGVRENIEAQARAEVDAMPVYAAEQAMAEQPDVHPDLLAEALGFTSGDQMKAEIARAETRDAAVARLAEERMRAEHPDMADAVAVERAAEALVAERARERMLATEAAALADAIGSRAELAQRARAFAADAIARRKVGGLRPGQFRAAADRAGNLAEIAFRKGDTPLAAKYKRDQVVQTAMHTEATAAEIEVDQALRNFKRMTRSKVDETRDGNLADTARAVLSQYGLAPVGKSPAEYLARVERYDPELYADLRALMDDLPDPVKHTGLTVGEFRAVRERVEAIWSLARSTREITIDGERMQINQAATALAEQLSDEPAATREQVVGTNDRLDLRMRLAGIRAALRRVEAWADARDRGARNGPFRRYLWQPVSEAVTRYRGERNAYVNRFLELLKPIEPTLKPGKIAAPELADGMVFADRSALLHALLHTGNESNLRKLLLGYRWGALREDGSLDTGRWSAFLDRMHAEKRITAADWKFVQGTWDLLEEMKPAAQRAHKQMFGRYFDEITAAPVQTPFFDLRGGYVPAITDALLVPEARQHGAMDDLLSSQASPMFPAVARGFTKARIQDYARPLALDLRLLPAHIDKVARFSTLGPVLRDASRLVMRNRTFRTAMDAVDPTAVESMLVPWLKRVATQTLNKAPETQADRAVARIANTVRNRAGLLLMAGNVVNTLQQVTGFSVAALRVKPRHLAAGFMELMRSPTEMARSVNTLSEWMSQRSDNAARDVDQTIERLLTNPSALQQAEQLGNRYGYVLQQATQNFMDRVVWLGAYRQAQADGVADAQAVRDADAAVRMTQSSFAPEDAARVEHAGAFTRLFLMFFSYFSGQANLLATEAQNASAGRGAVGTAGRLALVYLLGFAIPAFLAEVIAKGVRGELGGDDDDDALAEQLLKLFLVSQARYALGMAPVVGQAGNAAIGIYATPERFDDRLGMSPAVSAVESALRAPLSITRALEGEGNPRTAVRDGLTALGLLTGLPTGVLVRPLGYLADESRGDEVTLRGLVTGKAD